MPDKIEELFTDEDIKLKIQQKLPKLFHIAELESQRAGKIGMEVGSLRERILVALLIYYFGEENVNSDIPITEAEVDVKVSNEPLSIKTKTGTSFSGVKLIWTVDAQNAEEFRNSYSPTMGMIYTNINWGSEGGLYLFSTDIQLEVFSELGRNRYIKMPNPGTNPRGVEMAAEALKRLVNHNSVKKILINWAKEEIEYNAFERWIELWAQD